MWVWDVSSAIIPVSGQQTGHNRAPRRMTRLDMLLAAARRARLRIGLLVVQN